MCGRFLLISNEKKLRKRFHARSEEKLDLKPNYNTAPTQQTPIVFKRSPNHLEFAQFGLIPFWSKKPKTSYSTINAKSETAITSRLYSKPLRFQRCLVPSNGFVEWKRCGKDKQPYLFEHQDGEPFAMAGIWSQWQGVDQTILSFSIMTQAASKIMEPIHDRQPVVLRKKDEDRWLSKNSTEFDDIRDLLKVRDYTDEFERYPISKQINNVRNNSIRNLDRVKPLFDPLSEQFPY